MLKKLKKDLRRQINATIDPVCETWLRSEVKKRRCSLGRVLDELILDRLAVDYEERKKSE